ncbi:MAG: universal stress protein [Cyclobacteriaceae bacterium]|nr:universal stress protein [Cyclobacteriaceae bacterium]MDH4296029.1 universal stress protein [Cyclobacteriaceae bacterium]MDH5250618.1 universal stress protein [Cyclobacteriaceae bacterium]
MKNILVPTDFSENASNAAEYAAVIAQACKATILLLNVYTPTVSRYNVISALLADEVARAKNELKEKLQIIAKTLQDQYPGVKCNVSVELGESVEEILQAAKNYEADLIIMGTQGASSIEKILLGSNAAAIVEKAICPVMVIPTNTTCRTPTKIVYATDYAYSDIEGARLLAAIAKPFDATITFLHITTKEEDIDDEINLIEKFTSEIKLATNYEHINSKIISDNTVIMGLDDVVQNADADMLAVSTRRRNLFEKLYNPSITKKLANYTRIPLLAFKANHH